MNKENIADFDDIDSYIDFVCHIPPLNKKEERELIIRKDNGDINAYNKLVEVNLKRVIPIAKRYAGYGYSIEDLIQEGNIAVLMSIKSFKLDTGYLPSYVNRAIEWRMIKCVKTSSTVDISYNVAQYIMKLSGIYTKYAEQGIELATDDKLANMLGVSVEQLSKIKNLMVNFESVENLIELEQQDSKKEFVYDFNFDIDENVYNKEISDLVQQCIEKLSKKRQDVIKYYYGLIDGKCYTLCEISKILGVTHQEVGRRLAMALDDLKEILKRKNNAEFIKLYYNIGK